MGEINFQEVAQVGIVGFLALFLIIRLIPRIDRMDKHNIEAHAKMCEIMVSINNTLSITIEKLLDMVERCGLRK